MATVSFWVPEGLKDAVEDHEAVNWDAALREQLRETLAEVEARDGEATTPERAGDEPDGAAVTE